jgi:hypothetical protein
MAAAALAGSVAAATAGSALAGPGISGLVNRLGAASQREQSLHRGLRADTRRIAGVRSRIADLQRHLSAIQASLEIERAQLAALRMQLAGARGRLALLQRQLVTDRRVLAAQLVAQYESPAPDMATVVLESRGFADLLERVDDFKRLARQNVHSIGSVKSEGQAVSTQATRLAELEARQQRITSATAVQRNEIARIRSAAISRELAFARSRGRKARRLGSLRRLRHRLERRLSRLGGFLPGGVSLTGGASGGGGFGFFPAPGTNYRVGEEPQLAARLNALGTALRLHLIGISGYRSPSHSVEVGGFANDPHTRGQASDTPGIEGVPESTLNRFGLTRPFPGAAEADHIQLRGG